MRIYNVHAGHCPQDKGAYGAVGILKESVEDRIAKDEVIRLLKAYGHTVYDCTCDEAVGKNECLRIIVGKCNQHSVDLDVSIHLNSGRGDSAGDGKTGGVEVLNYDSRTKDVSDRICARVSAELGITNRGTKYRKDLYVLNNTDSPAILIECCFVDDRDDANKWNATKCAKAIVEGILNITISDAEGGWKKNDAGYWYQYADGTYPKSTWLKLDTWYYFDEKGYALQSRWAFIGGAWYYFKDDCRMATGWVNLNNQWYFLSESGAMVTGLQTIGHALYYFAADGHMCRTNEGGALI